MDEQRQNGDKYLITIEAIALIVVLVFGAVHFVMPGNNANTQTEPTLQNYLKFCSTENVHIGKQKCAAPCCPETAISARTKPRLPSVVLRKKAPQKGALPLISAKKANAAAFVVRSTAPGVRFGL